MIAPASGAVDWARVRAVSWDLDGTLYDLRALRWRALWPWAWRDARAISAWKRACDEARGRGGQMHGLDPGPARAAEARWLVPALRAIGPRAGVVAALDALADLPHVVVSDHPAEDKLVALGLRARFAHVIVGEALGWLKPSPRPFVAAAEGLGIPTDALLHVGDRDDTDGAGARAAGCQVVVLGPRDGLAPLGRRAL